MGTKTDIQWADSTVNLMVGCGGCELSKANHCYAEALVNRYKGMKGWPVSFDKPAIFKDRLEPVLKWKDLTGTERPEKPWLNGLPRLVFVNDLGDTFTESLDLRWLGDAVQAMHSSPNRYLVLTKRPKRAAEFRAWWSKQYCERWPKNVWLGTSVTSQANIGRLHDLAAIPDVRRFVSFEPLLGPLLLECDELTGCGCGHIMVAHENCIGPCRCPTRWNGGNWMLPESERVPGCGLEGYTAQCACRSFQPTIEWAIIGGESGKDARPCDLAWIRSLRDQGKSAGVATFIKQLGSMPTGLYTAVNDDGTRLTHWPPEHSKGGDWSEWPSDLRVREVPA